MPKPDTPLPDLRKATLEDLQAMQGKLSTFIDRRLEARKQEALDQIRRLSKEHDLTYEEVMTTVRTATRRGKAPPIYRNPEKPRQTWSGKGDAPSWFTEHKDPESLRIPGA